MKQETRTIRYDENLRLEAYCFEGISQPFPIHFHDYYVIGLMEKGKRSLICENKNFVIGEGDILLFNPQDKHACIQADTDPLGYRAFNIKVEVMDNLVREITGQQFKLSFRKNVVRDAELFFALQKLHQAVMSERKEFEKEELLLLTMEQMIQEYGKPFDNSVAGFSAEIEKACAYMKQNYATNISLNQLCGLTALSKATLIRSFAKAKGMSPYRFLENIRLSEAKKLLEQGALPIDAACNTGFSDQSHFTNFFKDYIGLTPKQYRDIFQSNRAGKINGK